MDKQRETGALLIAATLVAAIKLRGEKIEDTPRVRYAISESIQLARMVLTRIERG